MSSKPVHLVRTMQNASKKLPLEDIDMPAMEAQCPTLYDYVYFIAC